MDFYITQLDMSRAMDIPAETFRKFWSVCQPQINTARVPSSQSDLTMRGYALEPTVELLRRCTPFTDNQEAVLRSLARRSVRK